MLQLRYKGATEKRQYARRSMEPSDSVPEKHNKYNKRAALMVKLSPLLIVHKRKVSEMRKQEEGGGGEYAF